MRVALLGLFALAGCQLVFKLEEPACPGADGRYFVSTVVATWGDAFAQCMALDPVLDDDKFTHLAVFSDGEEAQAPDLIATDAWIGLHQNDSNQWRWVTDEFPDDSNAPWDNLRPTGNANVDCANLQLSNRRLDDAGCGMEKTFICECDEFPLAN